MSIYRKIWMAKHCHHGNCKIEKEEGYNNVVLCDNCNAEYKAFMAHAGAADPRDLKVIADIINGYMDIFECKGVYDYFYDLWCDDMPYGIMKARTGDPYEWITERLAEEYSDLIEQCIDIDFVLTLWTP